MDNCPDVGICASELIVHGTNLIDSEGDGFSTALRGFRGRLVLIKAFGALTFHHDQAPSIWTPLLWGFTFQIGLQRAEKFDREKSV
jgi:hypothetical protein